MNLTTKHLALIIFTTLSLSSCAPKPLFLKGHYLQGAYQVESDKTKDVVWDKVIDMFAQKGLPIKLIDRSSGLIISEKTGLLTTTEDKTGKILDGKAWVVVPGHYNPNTRKFVPAINGNALGEWNIRIKNDSTGKCLVNVNIVNLKQTAFDGRGGVYEKQLLSGRSTGVFEKMVADLIR
jgi:hypothetical protein